MKRALPIGVVLGSIALVALPLLQQGVEALVTLPIGPSRMVTIALWCLAWIPIARHVLASMSGHGLSRTTAVVVALVVPLVVLVHVLAFARLGDGPFGPVPGGPFRATASAAPPDWSRAERLRYAEVEVDRARPRTLETLVLVDEGSLYIAANMPEGKRWPRTVREDGGVRVRIGGDAVHALTARFVEDHDRIDALTNAMAEKYGFDASMGGPIWFFRLDAAR